MTTEEIQTLEIVHGKNPRNSIIWLHGLGATNDDFISIIDELKLPDEISIRFIFPQAPLRSVSLNGGYLMPAWYDIFSLDRNSEEDESGICASEKILHGLIEKEVERGISSDHIFLAGFSQGGAMALHTGIRYPKKLAGIIALSTYLPLRAHITKMTYKLPILMAHGKQDTVVTLAIAELSKKLLVENGYSVAWHDYNMEHSVCLEEIEDIRSWLLAHC